MTGLLTPEGVSLVAPGDWKEPGAKAVGFSKPRKGRLVIQKPTGNLSGKAPLPGLFARVIRYPELSHGAKKGAPAGAETHYHEKISHTMTPAEISDSSK